MSSSSCTIDLGNQITLIDNRELGCGVVIKGGEKNYASIYYHKGECYISVKGVIIDSKQVDDFVSEMYVLQQSVDEANKYLSKAY